MIGAKVRAVELTGKKVSTPAASLLLYTPTWPQGHQKCILLEHRGPLLKRFGCIKTMHHCFPVLAQMGPPQNQILQKAASLVGGTAGPPKETRVPLIRCDPKSGSLSFCPTPVRN